MAPAESVKQTSELAQAISRYMAELARKNASAHTIRNYASDLAQFLEYFTPPGTGSAETPPPSPAMITVPLPHNAATSLEDVQALRDALLFDDRIEAQLHWWKQQAWIRICAQVYVESGDIERLADAVLRHTAARG